MVCKGNRPQELYISAQLVLGFQVVDAGSGQDVLSKGLDAVKARVSLAKTGQHVAGALSLGKGPLLQFSNCQLKGLSEKDVLQQFSEIFGNAPAPSAPLHLRPGSSLKDRKPVEDS